MNIRFFLITIFLCSTACSGGGSSGSSKASQSSSQASNSSSSSSSSAPSFTSKAKLGEALFHDTRLSQNRNQSCATCHNPEQGFIDSRTNSSGERAAFSLGDDELSFGDRNAPSVAYAAFSPSFSWGSHPRFNSQQSDYQGFVGGQFWDGRAADLSEQAQQPIINPVEMALDDHQQAIERVQESDEYNQALLYFYGDTVLDTTESAIAAVSDAIAEFERSEAVSPFNSKYDKSLRGDFVYHPISKAAAGMGLFFSQQFTNCATCHQIKTQGFSKELFTSFEYHNIGVPANLAERSLLGKDLSFKDEGLNDQAQALGSSADGGVLRGKFKAPSLRNVAITAPYMHNGVFKNLRTVIEFYDHYQANSQHLINPETGLAWAEPEISENISQEELEDGRALKDFEVDNLVCFLLTLTDERYEHLIADELDDCVNF